MNNEIREERNTKPYNAELSKEESRIEIARAIEEIEAHELTPKEIERKEKNERLYNAIENCLARMHKRVSPAEHMEKLRCRFPNPKYILEANTYTLRQAGFSRIDAVYFSMIPALARQCMRDEFGEKPKLNVLSQMAEYLKSFYLGIHIECFYLICLDRYGKLIRPILMQKGNEDSAPFYLNQVLSMAVQTEAKAVVICHNHPRGTRRPSQEDIQCTLGALRAFSSTGILLLDHIIIAGHQPVSIRQCGFVPTSLWLEQNPKSTLNKNWLDKDLF